MLKRGAAFFGRKGTRSKYGQTPDRNLPPVKEESKTIEVDDSTTEQKKDESVDNAIDATTGRKDAEGSGAPATSKGKTVVKGNIASSKQKTSTKTTHSNVFDVFWSTIKTHAMHAVTFTDRVEFVPNCIPLTILCNDYFELVGRSNWIEKHELAFNPYAAGVALHYLYYIQILRAREAAGALTGNETSVLTRFRKAFPEEKINIPGLFVPYFESIIATEPSDDKYPWIVPSYGTLEHLTPANLPATGPFEHFHEGESLNYQRPMIPAMLAILCSFGATTRNDLNNHLEDGVFTPVEFDLAHTGAATRIFGQNIDMHDTAANTPRPITPRARIFFTGGMSLRFQFYNSNVDTALTTFQRSNFFGREGIDISAIPGQNYPRTRTPITETGNFSTLENFLFLNKAKTAHWADYLFEQLTIASKHGIGNKNLSEIATTGGMESTIACTLKRYSSIRFTPPAGAPADYYVYENSYLGITNFNELTWYDDHRYQNLTASFKTSRADIDRNEELQAFTFGINATLPFYGAERNASGSLFEHAAAAPNTDAMTYSEQGSEATTAPGPVNMYAGWMNNIVRSQFINKPVGM
nr:capsid protein [Sarcosphaera coronaria partitivirus]